MPDFAMPGFALLDIADCDPAHQPSFINEFGRLTQATFSRLPNGGVGDRIGPGHDPRVVRGQGGEPRSPLVQPWPERWPSPRAIASLKDWLQQPHLGLWLAIWTPVLVLMVMLVVDHQHPYSPPSTSATVASEVSRRDVRQGDAGQGDAGHEDLDDRSLAGTLPVADDVLTFDLLTVSEGDGYSVAISSESAGVPRDRADVNRGHSIDSGSSAASGRDRHSGPGLQSSGLQHWATGEPWHSDRLFAGGFDSLVARTVGAAEGTRTPTGDRTLAYYGHVDPGNGVWNVGTFSYQHGAASPQDADRKQLERLYFQAQTLRAMAADRNIPLTLEVELNGIDLANQAPKAALSEVGGYMDRLQEAYAQGYRGSAAVLEARVQSYLNPATNRWDAPGLGNTYASIKADQQRRQTAIALALSHYQGSLADAETDPESAFAIAPETLNEDGRADGITDGRADEMAIAALPPDASATAPLPDLDQYGVLSFGVY